eukprot:4185120-Pleurochrysis_carterae.AAC.1
MRTRKAPAARVDLASICARARRTASQTRSACCTLMGSSESVFLRFLVGAMRLWSANGCCCRGGASATSSIRP